MLLTLVRVLGTTMGGSLLVSSAVWLAGREVSVLRLDLPNSLKNVN